RLDLYRIGPQTQVTTRTAAMPRCVQEERCPTGVLRVSHFAPMQFIRTPAGVLLSGFAFGILAASVPLFTFWNELQGSQAVAARISQLNAELVAKLNTQQAEHAKRDAELQLVLREKQTS